MDEGLEVFSKKGGLIATYRWEDIKIVQSGFHPPFFYPVLKLISGDQIELHLANFREVANRCRENGIAVNETTVLASPYVQLNPDHQHANDRFWPFAAVEFREISGV